jgi:hypothetical protein
MSHSYYHPDLEDAVDYAKNEIKDDAEQGNLDPSMGQQRLPFEEDDIGEEKKKGVDGKACWDGYRYAGREQKADGTYKDKCVKVNNSEYAEAGPDPVKKNMDKFARPQTQPDRKKEMKRGKGVKHKGKDMAMESPVFDRYIKPIINKTPKQMVEFYDREARTIINRLSRERRSLAEANTDTKMHDVVIGRLRENLDVVSEAPYGGRFGGRDSWDSNMPGYDPGGELGSRDYRRNEPDFRANDEVAGDRFSRKFQQGPIYLQIDGKTYKQKGQPKEFSSMKAIQAYSDAMMRNNPDLKGRITFSKSV